MCGAMVSRWSVMCTMMVCKILYEMLSSSSQYELAVGEFPYKQYKNVFEQIKLVIEGEAPRMPDDMGFSENFKDYVHRWYV